jgi:predicted ATP-dependent protease
MIPASNVPDLMLRVAVVDAVREGKFHLWAVSTVDEGLEVVTGQKAKAIHKAAKARLTELAQTLKEFSGDS